MGYNILVINLLVPINEELVDLCINHTVITPNDRLAKEFTNSYDRYQCSKGKSAWESPEVKSFSNHLKAQFLDHMETEKETMQLMSRKKLFARLFSIIPKSLHSIINQAIDAIDLIHKYEVDVDFYQSLSFKCRKLIDWYKIALSEDKTAFLLESQLASFLKSRKIGQRKPLLLYQFDHLTSAEKNYLDHYQLDQPLILCNSNGIAEQLANTKKITIPSTEKKAHQSVLQCTSFAEELVQATKWAVALKTKDKSSTIGIVIPSLATRHGQISSQIAAGLDPLKGSHTERFNISSGQPLGKHVIWKHAFLFLRASTENLTRGELDTLINSKFFNTEELAKFLAQWQPDSVKNIELQRKTTIDFETQTSERLETDIRSFQKKELTDWVRGFTKLLEKAGWPSLDQLQTFEYQAYEAIRRELSLLEEMNLNRQLDFESALELLQALFENILHAPERQAQDIQVLGLIESIGLSFTHLWVCEMDEDNFPSRSNRNPFIPIEIKKQYGMPRADQEGELLFANTLLESWTNNSYQVNYSYNCRQNDTLISKSPLIKQIPESPSNLETLDFHSWFEITDQPLVETSDIRGPHLKAQSISSGLTMLKDQLNCPFKAFAVNRLNLTAKQVSAKFPQAFERGIAVHDVLAKLLSKCRTQEDVIKITEAQIIEVATEVVNRLFQSAPEIFRSRETDRISKIAGKWIDLEARRNPFQIIGLEKPFTIRLAGIEFSIRADRIDKLAEGLILIDYKTGRVNLSRAKSDNLKEPQLATYALAVDGLKGAFYAQLNDEDDVKVSGISAELELGDKIGKSVPCDWENEQVSWAEQLNQAAQDFVEGKAEVSPTTGYCTHCHLASLCRVG